MAKKNPFDDDDGNLNEEMNDVINWWIHGHKTTDFFVDTWDAEPRAHNSMKIGEIGMISISIS